MHSVDFEEFLWAKGYNQDFIEDIYIHLKEQKPFSDIQFKILSDNFWITQL